VAYQSDTLATWDSVCRRARALGADIAVFGGTDEPPTPPNEAAAAYMMIHSVPAAASAACHSSCDPLLFASACMLLYPEVHRYHFSEHDASAPPGDALPPAQDLGKGFAAVASTTAALAACASEFNGSPGKGGQYELRHISIMIGDLD
jgi:hypothetical protein